MTTGELFGYGFGQPLDEAALREAGVSLPTRRSDCPWLADLIDLAHGVAMEAAPALHAHVAECPACRERFEGQRRAFERSRVRLPDAEPATVADRAEVPMALDPVEPQMSMALNGVGVENAREAPRVVWSLDADPAVATWFPPTPAVRKSAKVRGEWYADGTLRIFPGGWLRPSAERRIQVELRSGDDVVLSCVRESDLDGNPVLTLTRPPRNGDRLLIVVENGPRNAPLWQANLTLTLAGLNPETKA